MQATRPVTRSHRANGLATHVCSTRCTWPRSPSAPQALRSPAVPLRSARRSSNRATVRANSTMSSPGPAPSKAVLIPVANGSEEMEAVIMVDVLRRAGARVVVASVEDTLQVTCSRGVKLVADVLISEAVKDSYDLIACPGGMPGAERLRDCAPLEQAIRHQASSGKPYAAICAAPAVFFAAKGMLAPGQQATAHPAFSDKLPVQTAVQQRVVVDGLVTTSRGPGTAFEFALSLVKQLFGADKAAQVAGPMVLSDGMVIV